MSVIDNMVTRLADANARIAELEKALRWIKAEGVVWGEYDKTFLDLFDCDGCEKTKDIPTDILALMRSL